MNLGKLLGAGKSFFGGGGNLAYREDKNFHLPKFNTDKNPFAPKPAEPLPVAAPEVKKVSTPVAARAVAKTQKTTPPPPVARPARAAGWSTRLNPFRGPEPIASPMVNAVQVELSLEAVKVVHNDLADADIEVVPIKSRTIAEPETPILPPARQAWEFMGERLLQAD